MKATRLIALVLSLMLIVAMFAGCSNDTAKTDDSSSSSSTSSSSTSSEKKEDKKEETKTEDKKEDAAPANDDPYAEGNFEGYPMAAAAGETLTYYIGNNGFPLANSYTSYEESPWHSTYSDMLGVEIVFESAPAGGDATQAYNLMLAAGDLRDIMYIGSAAAQAEDLIADEYIYEITDEMYQTYAPAYWALLEDHPDYKQNQTTDTHMRYGFHFWRENLINGSYEGMMIRRDLLDQVGMDSPVTIADWDATLRAFKDIGVKYPLTTWGVGAFNQMFTSAYNFQYGYHQDLDGNVVYGYVTDGALEYLTLINTWYKDGVVDVEFVTNDRAAVKTKVLNDEVGATRTSGSTVSGYIPELEALGSTAVWEATSYPVLNEGDQPIYIQRENPTASSAAVITTACENVPLALRVLDYGYTEEGKIFFNWGIEGESYEMVDGVPTYTDLFLNHPEGTAQAEKMYMGNSSNGPAIMSTDAYAQRTNPIGWNAMQMWYNTAGSNHMIPAITPTTQENAATASIVTAVDTYASEMFAKFLMGEEPLENFQAFVDECYNMGLQTVLDIKQAQLDRWNNR